MADTFHLDELRARQAAARAEAALNVNTEPTHLDALAVTRCGLCDDDGYRNGQVCDHIDHSETNRRGIEKCREALAQAKANRRCP